MSVTFMPWKERNGAPRGVLAQCSECDWKQRFSFGDEYDNPLDHACLEQINETTALIKAITKLVAKAIEWPR